MPRETETLCPCGSGLHARTCDPAHLVVCAGHGVGGPDCGGRLFHQRSNAAHRCADCRRVRDAHQNRERQRRFQQRKRQAKKKTGPAVRPGR